MQRFASFLEWRPSQIAAASLLLALNLNESPVAPYVGLKPLTSDLLPRLRARFTDDVEMEPLRELESGRAGAADGPLRLWNSYVAELTCLDPTEDIAAPYNALMAHLDSYQFKHKLRRDVRLWISTTGPSVPPETATGQAGDCMVAGH